MAVRVEGKDTYKFNTGKAPKGYGMWAFEVGNETFFFTGTFSEAQKAAVAEAKNKNVSTVKVMS